MKNAERVRGWDCAGAAAEGIAQIRPRPMRGDTIGFAMRIGNFSHTHIRVWNALRREYHTNNHEYNEEGTAANCDSPF